MHPLKTETANFTRKQSGEVARARALVSVRLLCGEDLDKALAGGPSERTRLARKLVLRLERERQKGLRGHWSYDLNRHIGLRQALDLVVSPSAAPARSFGLSG